MTREERLAKKRAYNKIYYDKNREKMVLYSREYRELNKEEIRESQRQYIVRNKDKVKQRKKDYYIRNRDKIREERKKNHKKLLESARKYRSLNSDKIKEYERSYYKISPRYRISRTLRARVRDAIKREHKSARTEELLGIGFLKFKQYLETLFKPNMSWDNYGSWEIDHIKPVASFDLTKESEQRKAFHYTNTQPLWRKENRLKSSKILN